MRIRIKTRKQGLEAGDELSVVAIYAAGVQVPGLYVLVNNGGTMESLSPQNFEVVNGDIKDFQFVQNTNPDAPAMLIHKLFEQDMVFFQQVLDFEPEALNKFGLRFRGL